MIAHLAIAVGGAVLATLMCMDGDWLRAILLALVSATSVVQLRELLDE